jgi:ParB family chromosome partitioning protein
LLPKIQDAFTSEEIDDQTVQYLTMASKQQQKDWLKLFENEDGNVPMGHQVRQWLLCRARHNSHYVERVIMPSNL